MHKTVSLAIHFSYFTFSGTECSFRARCTTSLNDASSDESEIQRVANSAIQTLLLFCDACVLESTIALAASVQGIIVYYFGDINEFINEIRVASSD